MVDRNGKRLIRRAEVCDRTGLPVSTLYRYMANGTFPKPVKIGEKSVAWVEDDVDGWIVERIDEASYPISIQEVMGLTGFSRKQLMAQVYRGTFPPPLSCFSRGVEGKKWKSNVVLKWLEDNPTTIGEV